MIGRQLDIADSIDTMVNTGIAHDAKDSDSDDDAAHALSARYFFSVSMCFAHWYQLGMRDFSTAGSLSVPASQASKNICLVFRRCASYERQSVSR